MDNGNCGTDCYAWVTGCKQAAVTQNSNCPTASWFWLALAGVAAYAFVKKG